MPHRKRFGLVLQLRELPGPVLVHRSHGAHLHNGPHDLDIDGDGAQTVQNRRQHCHDLFDERIGRIVAATRLKERRDKLAASDQVIKGFPEKLQRHESAEAALAEQIMAGQTYETACAWLLGAGEDIGRLAVVQAMVDQQAPVVHGSTRAQLEALLAERQRLVGLVNDVTLKLGLRANEVSFAQLYAAVSALSEGSTACPACNTDLGAVRENPFERAAKGLKELEELATLQKELRAQRSARS